MSEETTNGAVAPAEAATGNTGTAFTVEKIYAKDVSFEVPGGPAVFNEQAQPQLQMNLSQSVQRLGENAYEVVLGITLTCNAAEKPMYLVEVKQAGVFGLSGFEPAQLDVMLGGELVGTWRDARLFGGAAGALVYFWRRSVLLTIMAGMAVYLPLHLGLGW